MLKRLSDLQDPTFYLDKLTRDNLVIFNAPSTVTAAGVGSLFYNFVLPNDGYIYQLLHYYTRIITNATVATRIPRFYASLGGVEIFDIQDDTGITASYTCNYSHGFMMGFGAIVAGGYSSTSPIRTVGLPLLIGHYPDSFSFGIQSNAQIGDTLQQIQLRLLKSRIKNAFGDKWRSNA